MNYKSLPPHHPLLLAGPADGHPDKRGGGRGVFGSGGRGGRGKEPLALTLALSLCCTGVDSFMGGVQIFAVGDPLQLPRVPNEDQR